MTFIQSLQIISPLNSNIECVENKSDLFMKRALVHFKNGYKLSVIQGGYSYGGIQGLFEIAIFDKDGNWKPELFDGDNSDDVLGYQSVEDVKYYIEKIGNLS